jgi:hypothetical protein
MALQSWPQWERTPPHRPQLRSGVQEASRLSGAPLLGERGPSPSPQPGCTPKLGLGQGDMSLRVSMPKSPPRGKGSCLDSDSPVGPPKAGQSQARGLPQLSRSHPSPWGQHCLAEPKSESPTPAQGQPFPQRSSGSNPKLCGISWSPHSPHFLQGLPGHWVASALAEGRAWGT